MLIGVVNVNIFMNESRRWMRPNEQMDGTSKGKKKKKGNVRSKFIFNVESNTTGHVDDDAGSHPIIAYFTSFRP